MHVPPPRLLLAMSFLALACGPTTSASSDGGQALRSDSGPQSDAATTPDADAMFPGQTTTLQRLLNELRADRPAAMLAQSRLSGWPAPVEGGFLFVSTEGLAKIGGDHNRWTASAMTQEANFYWTVLDVPTGSRYKFSDGAQDWRADPWSRSYLWDSEGLMSMRTPTTAHLDRYFSVGDAATSIASRTLRVWVPAQAPTHLLYVQDGQNLFNPNANFGGWHLSEGAPAGLLLVGIDNTAERLAEYSHTSDMSITSKGDAYAAFVQTVVRPLIDGHYTEPSKVGLMGSSMGGLISLYIALKYPGDYVFAASLSGTLGWGSIGNQGTDTIIARYQAAGHGSTAIYVDSGGGGNTCVDSDSDGTNDDDPSERDNYCVTRQFADTLAAGGYQYDTDLWHWYQAGALHNEAAWATRVSRPLQDFMGL